MREMTYRELRDFYVHGECPYCDSIEWLEGPSGGMTTNIQCYKCGARVNVLLVRLTARQFDRRETSFPLIGQVILGPQKPGYATKEALGPDEVIPASLARPSGFRRLLNRLGL